jgi:phage recombination protein Bet
MTTTAIASLPANGDQSQWTESEKALVEAAGLVTGPANNRRLAPRPVVEAFLLHARRTGLDPIARQIYCIERGGQWGTQVSIDGARLVAERTGQYRGQTPTQWTADGITWVDVWLAKENPAAARVGVHREGFAEPLFAVATWDAYNANSPIWRKMPALMLGKCAEMLALRKAFPQDLSGLYSTEEMDQAGAPREVVRQAESHVPYPTPKTEGERRANAAAAVADLGPEAVAHMAAGIAAPVATRDWRAELESVKSLEECAALYREADAAGELGLVVGMAGDKDDGSADTVMDLFWARKRDLEKAAAEAETPPLVDVPKASPVKRQWVREARKLTTRDEVRALVQEAIAASAPVQVIEELEAIEGTLPEPEVAEPVKEWAVAQVPVEEAWTPEQAAEAEADVAGVLDETIGGDQ